MRKLGLQTYAGKEVFIDGESDTLYANNVPLKLDRAGTIATSFDGRYILVGILVSVGATIFWFTDCLVAVFDTEANAWKKYDHNKWNSPDSGRKDELLWVLHADRINHVRLNNHDVEMDVFFSAGTIHETIDPVTGDFV